MQWEDAASSAQAFYQTVLELTQNIQAKNIPVSLTRFRPFPNWERAINSLRVDLDATYTLPIQLEAACRRTLDTPSRRYVTVEVFPFSLKEIAESNSPTKAHVNYTTSIESMAASFLSHIDYAPKARFRTYATSSTRLSSSDIVQTAQAS